MNLGISQLAFDNIEDIENSIKYLNQFDIEYLEVVYFKMGYNPSECVKLLIDNGIKIKSTQSILFGSRVTDFLDDDFEDRIKLVSEKNTLMGVETIVLGSPKQRLEYREYDLLEKFKYIDTVLEECDQILCIEPNCRMYGGSYFFTVDNIVDFIQKGNFKNIRTMIDTHNIIIENESPSSIFLKFREYIHHVHVSEIKLSDFIESIEHENLSRSLKSGEYKGIVTYESLPSNSLKDSLEKFSSIYK